jgi:hypothetical protein
LGSDLSPGMMNFAIRPTINPMMIVQMISMSIAPFGQFAHQRLKESVIVRG